MYDAARSQEARFKGLRREAKIALLDGDEAFGCRMRKPPATIDPPPRRKPYACRPTRRPSPTNSTHYADEAHASQVRIATDRGDIVVELFPDDAPMHAAAFLKLVKDGFYDGLTFHRVEPGFVVQGGDPDGNGTGGPGYRLKAEFNARPHLRGTLAMARSSIPTAPVRSFTFASPTRVFSTASTRSSAR